MVQEFCIDLYGLYGLGVSGGQSLGLDGLGSQLKSHYSLHLHRAQGYSSKTLKSALTFHDIPRYCCKNQAPRLRTWPQLSLSSWQLWQYITLRCDHGINVVSSPFNLWEIWDWIESLLLVILFRIRSTCSILQITTVHLRISFWFILLGD